MVDTRHWSKIKEARRASGLSVEAASRAADISPGAYRVREDDPGFFRLRELAGVYASMNDTGKRLMHEALDDIFLDS